MEEEEDWVARLHQKALTFWHIQLSVLSVRNGTTRRDSWAEVSGGVAREPRVPSVAVAAGIDSVETSTLIRTMRWSFLDLIINTSLPFVGALYRRRDGGNYKGRAIAQTSESAGLGNRPLEVTGVEFHREGTDGPFSGRFRAAWQVFFSP